MRILSSFYDKFVEILHDLEEIDRGHLMKENRSIKDIITKMSDGIRDRYFQSKAHDDSEDKWEILQAFMKTQVEVSRDWVRHNADVSDDKTVGVKKVNTAVLQDKDEKFGPVSSLSRNPLLLQQES